ncbi:MAG: S1 RNA-binding domain-containing protein, partial [Candidatus Limnocylindrales bacterium]
REKRDELFSSLQVGQKVTGVVRSIAPFGVFVDLGGIDGLVHKSELSWNKVNNPEAGYRVGEEVEAEVIDINHERGRISLSIRRLQPDPWHSTVADLKVGDVIDGTVTKIVNFGAFVRVRDGLEGLIHISELSHQRVAHPGDVVHEGQTIKLKIISLEQDRHRLGLSLKQAEEAPAHPEQPAASGGGGGGGGGGAPERRERRPRGGDRAERGGGYDMSQAVQEPEGGIDNTLAAAFAQVRAQIEETEAAHEATDVDETAEAKPKAKASAKAKTPPAEEAAEAPAKAAKAKAAKAKAAKADTTEEPQAKPAAKPKTTKAKADTAEEAAPKAKAAKPAAKAKATKADTAQEPAAEKPAAKKPAASKAKAN